MASGFVTKKHIRRRGFTLIEVLFVMAIITLFSSIVVASLRSVRLRARNAQRLSDTNQVALALNLAGQNNQGALPSSEGEWRCTGQADSQICWMGRYSGSSALNTALALYLSKTPDDPRNNTACFGDAYLYHSNYSPPAPHPQGAYLHWYYEEAGTPPESACGGAGFWGGSNVCGPYCFRWVGPPAGPGSRNFVEGVIDCAGAWTCVGITSEGSAFSAQDNTLTAQRIVGTSPAASGVQVFSTHAAGRTYTASAWVSAPDDNDVHIEMSLGSGGSRADAGVRSARTGSIGIGRAWQFVSVSYTVPDVYEYASVTFDVTPAGKRVDVSDFKVVDSTTP